MKEKLLAIQKEIGAIKKEKKGVYNMYIDINTLLSEVKPILNKHEVVLMQGLTHINGRLALSTRLISVNKRDVKAGTITVKDMVDTEEMEFICPLPDCPDAQKYGSAITYFRRYSLVSLLALEAEDDDGQSASVPRTAKQAIDDIKSKDKFEI